MIFYTLTALILIWIGIKLINLYKIHFYVSKIPGPKRHLLFGNLPDLIQNDDEFMATVEKWGQLYPLFSLTGSLLPFAVVNIFNPEDIEVIISGMKHSSKSFVYQFLHNWLQQGLLTSNGTKWQARRKLLTPTFHFNLLQDFLQVFRKETETLISVIDNKLCGKANEINITPLITEFSLCSITETAMGTSRNLESENDQKYHNTIVKIVEVLHYRHMRPWLYNDLIYYYFTKSGMLENHYVKLLHDYTSAIISRKIKDFNKTLPDNSYSKRKKLAMLDLLIEAQHNSLIDFKGICEEVDTFMFEGHDTVSVSICFTLLLLANHKKCQDLIVQEIKDIMGDGGEVDYQKLADMKYLEMCIKESLRLYPSVPFISRVTDEDVILPSIGCKILKGTMINILIKEMHRHSHLYSEPEKFDPERFLPDNIANRHPFAYIPFSAGPRNCIGQKFAIMELKTVIIGILRNFILEPVDTPETIKLIPDVVMRTKYGIKLKFKRRTII